jgi:hypothetical protein
MKPTDWMVGISWNNLQTDFVGTPYLVAPKTNALASGHRPPANILNKIHPSTLDPSIHWTALTLTLNPSPVHGSGVISVAIPRAVFSR